jgi:hypothetical protein
MNKTSMVEFPDCRPQAGGEVTVERIENLQEISYVRGGSVYA